MHDARSRPECPGPVGADTPGPELSDSRAIEPTAHWARLLERIEALAESGPLLVAFSGGVDSTLLAKAAHDVGGPTAEAVTAVSPSLAASERADARRLAALIGIRHREVATAEADDPRYTANAPDRCFWCKTHLFRRLEPLVAAAGGATVLYGATVDDLSDVRPGMDAAREAGALAPFVEAGLGKDEIREASRRLALPTWDKPAIACLASRLPHGTPVTPARLSRVERAEDAIRALGFAQVRVRDLGQTARVEVAPDRVPDAVRMAKALDSACRSAGFDASFVDPEGYHPGKLNRPAAGPASEEPSR